MKKKKTQYLTAYLVMVGFVGLSLGSFLLSLDFHVNFWLTYAGVVSLLAGAIELHDGLSDME
jgi:hypothetical protein